MKAPFRSDNCDLLDPYLRIWAERERSITFVADIETDIADDLREFDRCILAGAGAALIILAFAFGVPALLAWWAA